MRVKKEPTISVKTAIANASKIAAPIRLPPPSDNSSGGKFIFNNCASLRSARRNVSTDEPIPYQTGELSG